VKERAMKDNDASFSRAARFISGLFFLVGDDKLAAKVRPSARRPGTVLESGDEGSGEAEAEHVGGESGKNEG